MALKLYASSKSLVSKLNKLHTGCFLKLLPIGYESLLLDVILMLKIDGFAAYCADVIPITDTIR